MKKQAPNGTEQLQRAVSRIGQAATLNRGILRGPVKVQAYRTAYGRLEFLVTNANSENEWVRETSLTFKDQEKQL